MSRYYPGKVRGSTEWMDAAACRDEEGENKTSMFFPENMGKGAEAHTERVRKTFCEKCPVKQECLDYANANRIDFGIWGGTTASERESIRRRERRLRQRDRERQLSA